VNRCWLIGRRWRKSRYSFSAGAGRGYLW